MTHEQTQARWKALGHWVVTEQGDDVIARAYAFTHDNWAENALVAQRIADEHNAVGELRAHLAAIQDAYTTMRGAKTLDEAADTLEALYRVIDATYEGRQAWTATTTK